MIIQKYDSLKNYGKDWCIRITLGNRDRVKAFFMGTRIERFAFNEDAYYGKTKGLWTHTNTRKDKVDMFPQQELMDMLVSL